MNFYVGLFSILSQFNFNQLLKDSIDFKRVFQSFVLHY
jgi:hypothetical protein